jgi:hypothetical protein
MRTGSPPTAAVKGDHEAEYTWFALGDSLPGISMDSRRAARQIVTATRLGTSEVILSLPAQLLARFHGLAPGLTSDILAVVNRLLPTSERTKEQVEPRKGWQSESPITRSPLTLLTQRADDANNERIARAADAEAEAARL